VDLVRWVQTASSNADVFDRLQETLRQRFGIRHCVLTSTGRAGLTLLLRAMRRLAPADRSDVILPSYTCFSVAASVVKAGLRPRLVDVSTSTLDFAPDQLERADLSRALAIVATNLYGMPNDLPAISEVATRHGVFVIDDAAQAMGASVGGRWSGTWGTAGLFSFDKGKNVSSIDGGAVVTSHDDLAAALNEETAGLPSPGMTESAVGVAKALAYFVLLRPWLYWIPHRIPQLELGKTVFTTEFPLERPMRPLVALGVGMMDRLDELTRTRIANATALLDGLRAIPGLRTIAPTAGAAPVYLRMPILIDDLDVRRRVFERLDAAGSGATGSYPTSLADIAEVGDVLAEASAVGGGRYVAEHIVTLPTHAFVSAADVTRTITALAEAVDAPAPALPLAHLQR
jgi:dTDP-4-amino-4,6-dideoxygalactose transaminase